MRRALPRWLLPTLLVLPFAVVLAVDVGRVVLARWFPPDPLISVGRIEFDPREVVFDLDERAAAMPGLELGAGWIAPRAGGRWTLDDRSRLRLELPTGDFRRLLVDCSGRPEGLGARDLALRVNGVDGGRAELEPGRQLLAFDLPEEALRRGRNVVELEHPLTTGPHTGSGRLALRWHRLALVEGATTTFADLDRVPAFEVDPEADRVLIRRSGQLVLQFSARGWQTVAWRYVFYGVDPGGGGPVVEAELSRVDQPQRVERATLDSARRQAATVELGPVRFNGPATLTFHVTLPGDDHAFEILEPIVGRIY